MFIVSKLLWYALRPGSLLLLLAVLGLLLSRARPGSRRQRLSRLLLVSGLGGLLLVVALPVGNWLLLPLEERFPQVASPPARVDGIIVLGGALETRLTEQWGIPSLNGAAERMTSFVALARRYPEAKLVFTGGSGLVAPGSVSEAQVARDIFAQLGLPPDRVLFESRSRNTWENAALSRQLAHPAPGEVWLLVTSASHMPRAVGIFRRVGWPVLPWPVAYKALRGWTALTEGSEMADRIGDLDWAVHEWVGLAAYRLMDRTTALLPGPD